MNAAAAADGGRYAVVGHPVQHSRSPFIHAEFARQCRQAMTYARVLCPLDAFTAALTTFARSGAAGCNVTMPFKFDAYALAQTRTERAERAGACNTMRFDATGWLGDNTDGAGLVRDIERNAGFNLRGARVLLIGAGGGAAGALGALSASGAAEIVIANRTVERAERLLQRLRRVADCPADLQLRTAPLADCGTAFDVVVNASASSVAGAPVPVGEAVLRPGSLALDMMYGAAAQPFVEWAVARGAIGRDGLGMLVEQAAEAFALWRGVMPQTAPVLAALRSRMDLP